MRQAEFAQFLADALNEYDAPGDKVERADVIDSPPAVAVEMRDGTRFLMDIEAVDESDYAIGRRT